MTTAIFCRAAARVVIVALCIVISICVIPSIAHADVFTITHVKVDEKAPDAAQAKVKAIAEAQRKAFWRLVQRLAQSGSRQLLPKLGGNDVAPLMASLSIEEEHTGPGRYIASLTIRFLPDQIRELFSQYNVPFTEEQASPLLLIPVWNGPEGAVLWEGVNPWRDAWVGLDLEHSLTPVSVPIGDLTDISAISPQEAMANDQVKLESIKIRYGAETIVVATAEPLKGGKIKAAMFGETPGGRIEVGKVYSGGETNDTKIALQQAARRFMSAIENKWKNARATTRQSTRATARNSITVAVPFGSFGEWNVIKEQINQTLGVADAEISSLSPNGGIVKISYEGSIQQLSDALSRNGLYLEHVGPTWVLQPN